MTSQAMAMSAKLTEATRAGRGSVRVGRLGLSVLLALVLGLLASAPAQAAHSYAPAGAFSGPGSGDGQLSVTSGAKDAAVDDDTGNLYVADAGNGRVEVFAPTSTGGSYLTRIAGLGAPSGIAIDQSANVLYVSDAGLGEVLKFSISSDPVPVLTQVTSGFASPSLGTGAGEIGSFASKLAVDPTSGDLLVADRANNRVSRFEPDGTPAGSFDGADARGGAFTGLLDIAADSNGDILVVDANGEIVTEETAGTSRVLRFDSAGAFEGQIGASLRTPGAVAAIPGSNEVLVAANFHSYWNSEAPEIHLFSAAGVETQSFNLPEAAIYSYLPAIAAGASAPARLYAITDSPDGGEFGQVAIRAYDGAFIATPDVVVGAASATEAGYLLTATVNPNGVATDYHFEYRLSGAPGWTSAPTQSAGAGTAPVPVEFELGTAIASEYEFRVVAQNADGSSTSATVTFTTATLPPGVQTLAADPVTATTARLNGLVNPRGAAATFYYEYGTGTGYGVKVPAAANGSAGSAKTPQPFPRAIAGLEPATTYHFRIVATSVAGSSQGQDRTFTTPAVDAVASRGYEMVSPVAKNGQDITNFYGSGLPLDFGALSSTDGNAAAFTSLGAFPGASAGSAINTFVARRGAGGWSSEQITPAQAPSAAFPVESGFMGFSSDLSVSTFYSAPNPPLTAGAAVNSTNVYRRNADGSYDLVSIGQVPNAGVDDGLADNNVGATSDLSKIFISTFKKLLPEHPENIFTALYEWDAATDSISYVGRMPGTDAPFQAQVYLAVPRTPGPVDFGDLGAISEDGSSVFFAVDKDPQSRDIYVRLNGTETEPVSASVASSPDPNGSKPADFWHAAADGSSAVFTSAEKLTDDATTGQLSTGADLYRWRAGGSLTDLTVDATDAEGAQVQGVLGGSEDGSVIYFAARGDLGGAAVAGQLNLYRWHDDGSSKGEISYVATGLSTRSYMPTFGTARQSRGTPDGEHLLFASSAGLTGYDPGGPAQLYLYSAADGAIECVSCNPTGAAASGPASLSGVSLAAERVGHNLSDDGSRAFFISPDGLLPADSNGKLDVYMRENGQLRLISSGKSGSDSNFQDASPSGDDVFFTTRSRLVGWDVDDKIDLYDARVGGGFPEPPPSQPPCAGEGCRPAATAPPVALVVGSGGYAGPGNVSARKSARARCSHQAKKGKKTAGQAKKLRKQKSQCKRGGSK